MKKFFFIFILFFTFIFSVDASSKCFNVPRCSGNRTVYTEQCYSYPSSTTVKMVIDTPVFSDTRSSGVAVDGASRSTISSVSLYIPDIDGYIFDGYYYNGGRVSSTNGIHVNYSGARNITGTICSTGSNGSVTASTVSVGSMPSSYVPITLTSKWKAVDYELELVDSKGFLDSIIMVNATNKSKTLPTHVASSNNDVVFAGWYYDSGFNKKVETDVIVDLDFKPIYNKSYGNVSGIKGGYQKLVLYAKWEPRVFIGEGVFDVNCPDGVATRVINFNTNGGNSINPIGISAMILKDNTIPTPVRDGYIFSGWYYDSTFKTKVSTNDLREVKYTPKEDEHGCTKADQVTLYAKWKKIETVEPPLEEPQKEEEKKPQKKPQKEPQKEDVPKCDGNVPSRIIYFDTNSGSGLDYITITDEKLSDSTIPTPVREGYDFLGWFYDKDLFKPVNVNDLYEIKYNELKDQNGCVESDKITLYAKWLIRPDGKKEYIVRYHDDSVKNKIYNDETKKSLLEEPKKDGFIFDGWYYDKDFTKKVEVKYIDEFDASVLSENKVLDLYAKWSVDESTLEKDDKGSNDMLVVGGILIFVLVLILIICIIVNKRKNNSHNDYEYLGL